jgi:PadR family transcriptional regulator AphA
MAVQSAKMERTSITTRGPSLAEYVILGLVAERPAHGFALARLVTADGPLGRVYEIPRPVVYRALGRLVDAGLVGPQRVEHGEGGPQRTVVRITPKGRRALKRWLNQPVEHIRDLRTVLLAKMALIERAGSDPGPLVAAQREVLEPIVAALAAQKQSARNFERTVLVWRYEVAQAAIRFLDDLGRSAGAG